MPSHIVIQLSQFLLYAMLSMFSQLLKLQKFISPPSLPPSPYRMYHDVLEWQQANCKPTMVLHAGSCLSLALRLLKAAAGFPTSSGTREHVHPVSRRAKELNIALARYVDNKKWGLIPSCSQY